jgi:hypothetical protein
MLIWLWQNTELPLFAILGAVITMAWLSNVFANWGCWLIKKIEAYGNRLHYKYFLQKLYHRRD